MLRAGHKVAFVWSSASERSAQFRVRFNDDAGLYWEVDTDLHLQKLDKRDW